MDEQEFNERRRELVEETSAELGTEEGRRLLAKILAGADAASNGDARTADEIADEVVEGLEGLGSGEREAILGFMERVGLLHEAFERSCRGMNSLLAQGLRLVERASELEPDKEADSLTVAEAIEILKRHGEKPGLSEEVYEIVVEVPTRES